jgi:hypothetical protein
MRDLLADSRLSQLLPLSGQIVGMSDKWFWRISLGATSTTSRYLGQVVQIHTARFKFNSKCSGLKSRLNSRNHPTANTRLFPPVLKLQHFCFVVSIQN